ncbi:hypothetical protein Tco_0748434 [Tanacetum coccineum]|uniref:Uncharacterized protein n=1 Tax=Tanacetum coccineum TaxID=301880 RepID=A0ABQ4YZ11_9ASTR
MTTLTPHQNYIVSPLADTTVPSQQELDILFGPLYDEFFNGGTSRVNKSSSPTYNSIQKDTLPSMRTFTLHQNRQLLQMFMLRKTTMIMQNLPFLLYNDPEMCHVRTHREYCLNKYNFKEALADSAWIEANAGKSFAQLLGFGCAVRFWLAYAALKYFQFSCWTWETAFLLSFEGGARETGMMNFQIPDSKGVSKRMFCYVIRMRLIRGVICLLCSSNVDLRDKLQDFGFNYKQNNVVLRLSVSLSNITATTCNTPYQGHPYSDVRYETSKQGKSYTSVLEDLRLSWKPCQGDSLNLPDPLAPFPSNLPATGILIIPCHKDATTLKQLQDHTNDLRSKSSHRPDHEVHLIHSFELFDVTAECTRWVSLKSTVGPQASSNFRTDADVRLRSSQEFVSNHDLTPQLAHLFVGDTLVERRYE